MPTTNPNGALTDATVSITLSGEHVQVVLSQITYQLWAGLHTAGEDLEHDGLKWPTERFETYAAIVPEIVGRYAPAIRQLEQQGVREPLQAQPGEDVKLTWTPAMLARVARSVDEDEDEPGERRPHVARSIREQLEVTR